MPFCLSKRVCALAIGFRVCYTECQFNKSEFVRNSKFKFILLESVFREIRVYLKTGNMTNSEGFFV